MKERAKEHIRLMEILWEDLDNPIKLGGTYKRLGRVCFERFREARKFLQKRYPDQECSHLDLPFLDESAQDLSTDELESWKLNVSYVRGYLANCVQGK